ncbi:carbon storage regulator CsrA [Allorhodopirellula solitaria]|uniref:Translational regulator CsrA n=1 Tax=Allorhodopirellula solitaria TaxID=2527987 RepID=A0A5C5XZS4_9BACT|nr:carbon storage regulator CsrA [Allorhodopirellula solitaria]TWT67455.1 Carbon storage regulator [Allorhodopirellula solitaria]
MLVLTRKLNEKIKIGDDVTITIIKLRNNQIRIGIEAPRDVRVLRAELEHAVRSDESDAQPVAAVESSNADRAVPSNRVREFLADHSTEADTRPRQPRGKHVVDGLMSADEMVAAGKDSDDERFDDDSQPEHDGDHSPSAALQVFSGKIGCDGELREHSPATEARLSRAPLAGFFTAP